MVRHTSSLGFLPELKLGSKNDNDGQSDADSVGNANLFIDSFENNIDFPSFLSQSRCLTTTYN